MSYPPPYGQAPPPYGQPGWHAPPHPPHYPYPAPDYGQVTPQPPMPIYVPGTMMVPVPMMPQPQPQPPPLPQDTNQPTYVTNYIYHGETSQPEQVQISETSGDYDWVPSTSTNATSLTGRAVVGGREGWDGSPLWVIRAWHNGDLIPGKLSVRHCSASVMYSGKEIPVQNIEVLCAKPNHLRWVAASSGNVPPGAIAGGRTASGETLYVGRARHQLSVTPGKVHRTHKTCYIGFGGAEVAINKYDVLCRLS